MTCERTKPVALSAQYLPRKRVPWCVTVRACVRVSVRGFVRYGPCVCACARESQRACVRARREKKGKARGGGRDARGQVGDDVRMVGLL